MIFTNFSSNTTKKDIQKACSFLFLPVHWKSWRKGEAPKQVESWLKNYLNTNYAKTFDSGRSSLFFALKALGVGEGDEVLVQGYTCVVVINAIKWLGGNPVYVDIGDDFNIDPEDLKKKITSKSKVLIIQHTFGQPAKIDEIMTIAKENNLEVIEDCAHALGTEYNGKRVGTFGDVAMFSFGTDKVVSCVRGGALITDNDKIAKKIEKYSSRLPQMERLILFGHLMHYPIFTIGKALYKIKIGKWILGIAKKLYLINRVLYNPEKLGKQVHFFPSIFPNALAEILLDQLNNLEKINQHRSEILKLYNKKLPAEIGRQSRGKGAINFKYLILVEKPNEVLQAAKKQGILLGIDWSGSIIVPKSIDIEITGYKQGCCSKAELAVQKILFLPTHTGITKDDVEKITNIVKQNT